MGDSVGTILDNIAKRAPSNYEFIWTSSDDEIHLRLRRLRRDLYGPPATLHTIISHITLRKQMTIPIFLHWKFKYMMKKLGAWQLEYESDLNQVAITKNNHSPTPIEENIFYMIEKYYE